MRQSSLLIRPPSRHVSVPPAQSECAAARRKLTCHLEARRRPSSHGLYHKLSDPANGAAAAQLRHFLLLPLSVRCHLDPSPLQLLLPPKSSGAVVNHELIHPHHGRQMPPCLDSSPTTTATPTCALLMQEHHTLNAAPSFKSGPSVRCSSMSSMTATQPRR